MEHKEARLLALYLPQFHPIPENDKWWSRGFTEWTNVGKAKPFYKGHYQPRVPADLGYYDLRVPETRQAQADLAKKYGIEGFVYWHYWFGNGKRLLERPFNEVLESGEPNFPFALAWANETWKGFPHGLKDRNTLIEQKYSGIKDYTEHFKAVLPAFQDERYIRIDDKPFFMILKPLDNKEVKIFIKTWRRLAVENGLKGIYFVGHKNSYEYSEDDILNIGFDAINPVRLHEFFNSVNNGMWNRIYRKFIKEILRKPNVHKFSKLSKYFINHSIDSEENVIPTIITGWDHTPRSGRDGLIVENMTPSNFKTHVHEAFSCVKHKKNKVIMIKSWNEWAEGNYLEPDLRWGSKFLEVIRSITFNNKHE